jgi:hypothetical protein
VSTKQQLLDIFSEIGKSAADVNYYRISPWSSAPTIKGKSDNIFDFMLVLDELDKINHLSLAMIVFHDNTWISYDIHRHEWEYNCPPSYNEIMS